MNDRKTARMIMRKSSVCGEYAISISVELCDFENRDFSSLIFTSSMRTHWIGKRKRENVCKRVFADVSVFLFSSDGVTTF